MSNACAEIGDFGGESLSGGIENHSPPEMSPYVIVKATMRLPSCINGMPTRFTLKSFARSKRSIPIGETVISALAPRSPANSITRRRRLEACFADA